MLPDICILSFIEPYEYISQIVNIISYIQLQVKNTNPHFFPPGPSARYNPTSLFWVWLKLPSSCACLVQVWESHLMGILIRFINTFGIHLASPEETAAHIPEAAAPIITGSLESTSAVVGEAEASLMSIDTSLSAIGFLTAYTLLLGHSAYGYTKCSPLSFIL